MWKAIDANDNAHKNRGIKTEETKQYETIHNKGKLGMKSCLRILLF